MYYKGRKVIIKNNEKCLTYEFALLYNFIYSNLNGLKFLSKF